MTNEPLTKLDELARVYSTSYASPHHFTMSVELLRNLIVDLASQVAQEPVAWRFKQRINGEFDSDWILTKHEPADGVYIIAKEPLYAVPLAAGEPQKQQDSVHLTARSGEAATGREDGGGVPASDNWQQYAKDGETAQACIERHRREQDALMKLLAQAREPLADHEVIALLPAGWTGMLAQVMEFARRIQGARGVKEQSNG